MGVVGHDFVLTYACYKSTAVCYLKVYVAAGVLFGKHLLVRLGLYGEIVYGMAELLAAKA